ncbi:gfo/Idh/MocA family oxidoreductase [Deinococcus irradiatisoli]|uniref:Gfo/Idh/MocA family oxidoreductase n=1 Tax=Deinococcus irradiatisoli TaxID=2202254 RepID=A0A2Z3JGV2_9DEIO|nr:Gfo/Idh/MocA family oxidoreductase [Deinococcus irradiatisoli]AWN22159.1 gfo/Idh/MocA family oxidoreductase [Deinococcus irradiatisoli]
MTPATPPIRLAIIGCGVIAGPYAQDIQGFKSLKLHGCFDVDTDKARRYAETHGCRAYASLEEALGDPDVDVVVNLTVLPAHYSVNKQALEAGKHVYSEKPLAATAGQAQELVALARERGVRLSGAPATWLGHAQQRALRELQAGSIGPVRVIYAEANHGRIERWHPVPHSFYQVGPLRDVGVYPLGVITSIFGPARQVWAYATILKPQRVTKRGEPFTVSAPDWYAVMIELESGPLVRLTASFYVSDKGAQPEGIEFHGDDGQLLLGDWFQPGGGVRRAEFGETYQDLPDFTPSGAAFSWAAGLDDLGRAIREDRPHRLSGEQATHIVEILEAAHQSIASGQPVEIHSRFVPAAPVE